jgi:hypothetical protein
MATVTYDTTNKLLVLDQVAPDGDNRVTLQVKRDIYSDAKRQWLSNPTLFKLEFPFFAVGGFDLGNGVLSGTDYFLSNDVWKVKPYEADHELALQGNLRGSNPTASLFVTTTGAYTVTIIYERSSLTQVVTNSPEQLQSFADAMWDEPLSEHTGSGTSGRALSDVSGSSSATPAAIAAAVWNEPTASYATSTTFGYKVGTQVPMDVQLILSLAGKKNFRLVNPTYDANGKLETVTIRSFGNPSDAQSNSNPTAQLAVSASYDGSGNLSDYVVVNL